MAKYTPRRGSVAARLIEFLRRNPDEELTRADIAAKFEIAQSSIDAQLAAAMDHGVLATKNNEEMQRCWCAGPKLNAARIERDPANALPPPESLKVESGVPIPEQRKGTLSGAYTEVFMSMGVGDSVLVPKHAGKRLYETARRAGKSKSHVYAMRLVDDGQIRIWRTA